MTSEMDLDILMDAACNDHEVAVELMKLFFNLTGQEQTRLAEAIAQGNDATASAISHKVAGSCSSCGMIGLSARFKELEHLCKHAIPADINNRLQTIDQEMQDIRKNLEEHFNCSLAP